jgi:D-lyxose ketol-isomerase
MIKRILALLALNSLLSANLFAAIGCMDNSYHLQKKYDTKSLHYVQCNCHCYAKKALPTALKCIECGHYHMPRAWYIVNQDGSTIAVEEMQRMERTEQEQIAPDIRKVVATLIKRYQDTRK